MVVDLVVRARVYTMDPAEPVLAALAVTGGRIIATSPDPAGLDHLVVPGTAALGGPDVTVLPAFVDTHNHLMLAARNVLGVPVSRADDIPGFVDLIRQRAGQVPPGEWIVTAADWHELRLAEHRLPTARELDEATRVHPVLAQRGGHNGVLNSMALRLAGIDADTADLPGGLIERDAAGEPTGWVQDAALEYAQRAVPALSADVLEAGLAEASAQYAARGIGTVRDPMVTPAEWRAYLQAHAAGRLSVRSHAMIITTPAAVGGSVDGYLDDLEAQGIRPGAGEDGLRLWGLKLILDGGVEAAALAEPYAGRPDYRGHLLWDDAALAEALATAVRRGWPVGAHALGDRAVAQFLTAVAAVGGAAPRGTLVMEHGGLMDAGQRAAAADLGVHVTAQQPLLANLGAALTAEWGPDRVADLFPLRALLDGGAWVSAGTDHPIGPLDPLRAVRGMETRGTPFGVLGPEHAITRAEALRLYTTAGAELLGESTGTLPAGTLITGGLADLVGYPEDPTTCPPDRLLTLSPTFTVVAGKVVHGS